MAEEKEPRKITKVVIKYPDNLDKEDEIGIIYVSPERLEEEMGWADFPIKKED